jgi:hypothetical protein
MIARVTLRDPSATAEAAEALALLEGQLADQVEPAAVDRC